MFTLFRVSSSALLPKFQCIYETWEVWLCFCSINTLSPWKFFYLYSAVIYDILTETLHFFTLVEVCCLRFVHALLFSLVSKEQSPEQHSKKKDIINKCRHLVCCNFQPYLHIIMLQRTQEKKKKKRTARKNTGCLVSFDFQINNDFFYSISMSDAIFGT